MVMMRWQRSVTDDAGNIVPNASVEVREEIPGTPLVQIFSDRDGTNALTNPFNADANGFAAFYAVGGTYRITATSGGFSAEWRDVGIGTAQGLDADDLSGDLIFNGFSPDEVVDTLAERDAFNNEARGFSVLVRLNDASPPAVDPQLYFLETPGSPAVWSGAVPFPTDTSNLGVISLLNSGAAGDGVTDDTANIITAAENLRDAGGGILDGAGKTYRVDGEMDLTSFQNVTMRNATFDFSNVAATGTLFGGGGSLGTETVLTADATTGSNTLTVTDSAGFAVGAWCMLQRNQLWGTDRGNVAELVRIHEVISATSITVLGGIDYNYLTSDNARLTLINPIVNINFERCTFLGNNSFAQSAFDPLWVWNIRISNCLADGWNSRAFGFEGCWDIIVEGCRVQNGDGPGGGTHYGVAFTNGCHFGIARDCTFIRSRHGITVGGGNFVNRYVGAERCRSIGGTNAAFDSHRDCDHFFLHGCVAQTDAVGNDAGITCQATRAILTNNQIYGTHNSGNAILVQWLQGYADVSPSAIVSNNMISSTANNGINISQQSTVPGGPVTINGNQINPTSGGTIAVNGITVNAVTNDIIGVVICANQIYSNDIDGIMILNSTGNTISRGSISSNEIDLDSTASGAEGIRINGDAPGDINRISIIGNMVNGGNFGIRATNDDFINVVGNVTNSTNGVQVAGANSAMTANING